ncbi:MAG: SET domain-containing protein-lysine N-methyltransferase [Magnetovibrio sp.]|nr:SET domain-containing protein-lysine N-methyltransferase [Magnetovibrio sp.]
MKTNQNTYPKIQVVPPVDQINETFYPAEWAHKYGMALRKDFDVFSTGTIGLGIRAKVPFSRGSAVASFTGQLIGDVLQHTLQVTPTSHLHDPYFIGLLTHSCAPNCLLDMQNLDVLALTDIAAGDTLTIDYALTEDVLFRQFPCSCGSAHCRNWITGRRDPVNEEGLAYLDRMASEK